MNANISNSSWHPEFNLSIPNKALEVKLAKQCNEIIFEWK